MDYRVKPGNDEVRVTPFVRGDDKRQSLCFPPVISAIKQPTGSDKKKRAPYEAHFLPLHGFKFYLAQAHHSRRRAVARRPALLELGFTSGQGRGGSLAPARIVAVVSAVFANFFNMLPSQGFEVMEGG
jgi:hypothetical protein